MLEGTESDISISIASELSNKKEWSHDTLIYKPGFKMVHWFTEGSNISEGTGIGGSISRATIVVASLESFRIEKNLGSKMVWECSLLSQKPGA